LEAQVRGRTEKVRELAARPTIAEHEERDRVAQILHDKLQQQL
jgi:signal transduction histidine kinase